MSLGLHCKDLILAICFNIPYFFCFSGVMGSTTVFNSDGRRSFPKRPGNNLLFNSDIVKSPIGE